MSTLDLLRNEIKSLEAKLEQKKSELTRLERSCIHQWTKPQADHIYHEGYTIPGDTPGTMGVDWRGPTYVSPTTTEQWKRQCTVCGKIEHTSNVDVKTQETRTPRF